eukprot:TRINITY_DN32404_c0_g1_i1.p1 TRINITY_DN32404_c0_g1~~TRINITY_DN32404_c0_g1_i1.p1  ORF type:complete len:552 (+),score=129.27 TRINITY_DN32404_c0_g1_i1:42-1697(+)
MSRGMRRASAAVRAAWRCYATAAEGGSAPPGLDLHSFDAERPPSSDEPAHLFSNAFEPRHEGGGGAAAGGWAALDLDGWSGEPPRRPAAVAKSTSIHPARRTLQDAVGLSCAGPVHAGQYDTRWDVVPPGARQEGVDEVVGKVDGLLGDSGDTAPAAAKKRPAEEGALEAVMRYVARRGVTFREVSGWAEEKRRRIVEQAIPDDPIGQHQAWNAWDEQVQNGRLEEVPRMTPKKLRGIDAVERLKSAIRSGDVAATEAGWKAALEAEVPVPILGQNFSAVCRVPALRTALVCTPVLQELFEAASTRRFDLKFYTSILSSARGYKEVQRTVAAITSSGLVMDGPAWAAAMTAVVSSPAIVRNLISNMKRARGVRPSEMHYGILLRSCGMSAGKREVLEVWELMQQRGFTQEKYSYAIMMKAVAPFSMDTAHEIYKEAKEKHLLSDRICQHYMDVLTSYEERLPIAQDFIRFARRRSLRDLPPPMHRALYRDMPAKLSSAPTWTNQPRVRERELKEWVSEAAPKETRKKPPRPNENAKALWEVLRDAEASLSR